MPREYELTSGLINKSDRVLARPIQRVDARYTALADNPDDRAGELSLDAVSTLTDCTKADDCLDGIYVAWTG
jgi:hypothetical protein